MLILSRARMQSLVFTMLEDVPKGTRFVVQVHEIKMSKVKLGTDAPKSISVHRDEIQAIRDQTGQS